MSTPGSLSNLQVELLKLYANHLPEEQLRDIKLMLAHYFANKATEAMNKVWDERDLTEQDMVNWTNEHNRVTHRP